MAGNTEPSANFATPSVSKIGEGVETRRRVRLRRKGIVQTSKFANWRSDENRSGTHNLETAGAIPAPATAKTKAPFLGRFSFVAALWDK